MNTRGKPSPIQAKVYRCEVCGAEQVITINHEASCLDYCRSCSWKPSIGPFTLFGVRAFRRFNFVSEVMS